METNIYSTEDLPRAYRHSHMPAITDPQDAKEIITSVVGGNLLRPRGNKKQQAARLLAPIKRELVMENPEIAEHLRIGQSLVVKPDEDEESMLSVNLDNLPMDATFDGQALRNLCSNVFGISADPTTFGCIQQAAHINHFERPLNARCIEKPVPYSIYIECMGGEGHQYIRTWSKNIAWARFSELGGEIEGDLIRARREVTKWCKIIVTNPDFNWDEQSLEEIKTTPIELLGNADIAIAVADYTAFSEYVGNEGMEIPRLQGVIEQSIVDGIEKLFEMGYLNPSEVQEGMRKMFPTLNLSVERRYEHLVSRAVANAINNMPMNEIIKNILRALLPVNALRKLN